MSKPLKVLIAEDSPDDAELTVRGLRKAGFEPEYRVVETEEDFRAALLGDVELVLSDYSMPQMNALKALELVSASGLDLPLIIISGTIGEETAVDAMRKGAADYLLKDRLGRLGQAVSAVLEQKRLRLERHTAERIHGESERRFREMLENVELIALMLDADGRVTFCNDFLLLTTGWRRDEVVGADWLARFIPEAGDELRNLFFLRLKEGKIPPHHQSPVRTRTGELREILWNNTMLRDSEGRTIGIASVGEDVTERRRAEQALRASEERFRQIAEYIQEVFWIEDQNAKEVLYVSPAYATIWGRSCESLYKAPGNWIDSIHPDDKERVKEAATAKRSSGSFDETYRIVRPDGVTRWIRDRAFPVWDKEGRIYRFVGTAEDITEHKKLEEQFLRAQRLESLGMLAAGIAHDLNNVLAPVLMAAPMLRENIQDSEDLALLTTVEKSASRGAALVKQILSFAHGIGGEPVVVQVRHLVNDVAAIIRETFPKNIRLELQIDQDPWTITGNPTQIHQVLLNLCVNARDAMPEGGSLRLRCENCVFDERAAMAIKGARAGPWLVLDVEDTGTGMEPAVQAHIWEPFFTTKTADKGTGLGLSTVRGIVETHHGFIALASQPGQGTRFRVFLPATGGEAGVENPIPAAPRGGGEFILVVDDEATIREMVKAIVSSHGYRVLAAVDGIEAIAMLAPRTGEIDIVVADMLMPRLGGRPLIDVIRRLNPSVKLLAMSGSHEGWDAVEGRGSRADSFIMKPFTGEELLTKIHSLLHPVKTPGA